MTEVHAQPARDGAGAYGWLIAADGPLTAFVTPAGELMITTTPASHVELGEPIPLADLPAPARVTADAFTRTAMFRPMDPA